MNESLERVVSNDLYGSRGESAIIISSMFCFVFKKYSFEESWSIYLNSFGVSGAIVCEVNKLHYKLEVCKSSCHQCRKLPFLKFLLKILFYACLVVCYHESRRGL